MVLNLPEPLWLRYDRLEYRDDADEYRLLWPFGLCDKCIAIVYRPFLVDSFQKDKTAGWRWKAHWTGVEGDRFACIPASGRADTAEAARRAVERALHVSEISLFAPQRKEANYDRPQTS